MSFNIDEMEDNILHAIAVAKEKHKVEEDFSFINGLPTNEEEYNKNIRWLNGEDKDSDNGESIVGAADVFAGFNRGETDTDTLTMDSFTEFTKPNIL